MKQRTAAFWLLLLLISCTSFFSNRLVQVDYVNKREMIKDSLIQWSAEYELKWSDFLGNPDYVGKYKTHDAVTYVRKVTTKWELFDDRIEFTCVCYFSRYSSWKKTEGDVLLKHERGHFDIVEINMRRFRNLCSEHKSYDLQSTVDFFNLEFENMRNTIHAMHDLYDSETDFSKNKEAQKRWDKEISDKLNETETWSDIKVVIKRY